MSSHTCPKCQGTMTEGFLLDTTYGANNIGKWVEGTPQISIWGGAKLRDRKQFDVQSWRCKLCGFLENYARF